MSFIFFEVLIFLISLFSFISAEDFGAALHGVIFSKDTHFKCKLPFNLQRKPLLAYHRTALVQYAFCQQDPW